MTGELWNVDLWFFDSETISAAEQYGDNIASQTDQKQKAQIVAIKSELIKRGLYSFDKYKSIDVYKAVLENGVENADEFLALSRLERQENT